MAPAIRQMHRGMHRLMTSERLHAEACRRMRTKKPLYEPAGTCNNLVTPPAVLHNLAGLGQGSPMDQSEDTEAAQLPAVIEECTI
ncbi:uncharacterized protein BDR25DRAFT_358909 [Lindgomyces ingoldianus]|uniref:Uncharacterized protein n=1 Tax=Lindgomyces ingoldianus TaxID=673940 RepID=A0ACB6QK29_9PLEO|nr:uncharacterized protein BDR25DRAFT_358909 [Lindgomyces ingoldianus]KAF2467374.1 hypothetical protein BDR25DRAFT_358909 [Lindgomyces ingoldianus]